MFYRDAEASPAVAVVGVAAGATLLVAAGATSYYQNSTGASAAASAAGNIYSNVVAYTQATSAVGQAVLYSQACALKTSAEQLLDALSQSASNAYAALKHALGLDAPLVPPAKAPPSGSIAPTSDGTNHLLGSFLWMSATNPVCSPPSSWTSNGQVWVVLSSYRSAYNVGIICGSSYGRLYDVAVYADGGGTTLPQNTNTPPLPPPATAIPNMLGGAGVPVSPDIAKDINDLIKANPSIATPVTSSSAAGSLGGSTTVDVPYTPELPVGTTVSSNPATTIPTQIPTQDTAVDPPDVYPSTNAVELKKIDLRKWTQLYGVMQNTFPFSLLTTLSGYLDAFVTEPVAPSFDMHVYQDKKLHIDLSFFDPVAALVRWVIGILLTIGAILGMQKWWRGVS